MTGFTQSRLSIGKQNRQGRRGTQKVWVFENTQILSNKPGCQTNNTC